MSRLLDIKLALPLRAEPGLARIGRTRLVAITVAIAALLGAILSTSDVAGKLRAQRPTDLPVARARAIANARARAATRPSRSEQVAAVRVRTADVSHAGALFATHSWYVAPPPPPPPTVQVSAASLAPPAPTAPPLPFQYIGSYKADGEAQVFFLTNGDRVYDAKIGDVLENTYSVDSFDGSRLLLTYKPLDIRQQLSAGGSQ